MTNFRQRACEVAIETCAQIVMAEIALAFAVTVTLAMKGLANG